MIKQPLNQYLKKYVKTTCDTEIQMLIKTTCDAEIQLLIKFTSINSMKLLLFKCCLSNKLSNDIFIRYMNNSHWD